MSFSKGGEGPCPYHKQVLVKWEIRGQYLEGFTPKAIKIEPSKDVWGKIECKALSEDGTRCQVDLGPCPADQIIEYFVLRKPVGRKF